MMSSSHPYPSVLPLRLGETPFLSCVETCRQAVSCLRGDARRQSLGEAGATLAEMLVVIATVGILAGLMMLNFSEIRDSYRLRGAAREVYAQLQRARMSAVTENNRYRFSISGSTYKIHDDDDNDTVEDVGEVVVSKNIQTDSYGVTLAATNPLIFVPNGTVLSAEDVTVTNLSGDIRLVKVTRAGRIQIY